MQQPSSMGLLSFHKGFESVRKHRLTSYQDPVTTVRGLFPDL
jgi:hypothetical protein